MTSSTEEHPLGVGEIDGIAHVMSAYAVADTVRRLTQAIEAAGAKVFIVVDHSGEAARAGMALRDTKLIVFGSPKGGTPVMKLAPSAALDLPLKVLVWEDDGGAVWMTYLSARWLVERHQIPPEVAGPLSVVEGLVESLAASR